ncbi:hypothetical protein EYF80_016487 [Liparis tanakae]|uniref:Uncharacterized protein n=1 Tax=Liparis tanakae TaxID=230148 RepID=A0A4Z2I7N7_9TELE|nr:hypothetical protein EYF80_016487 [Liparis tanakae]
MPRSFLVKKIKLDDSSSFNVATSNHHHHHHHHLDDSFTFARSITDSVTSLGVRLSENVKDRHNSGHSHGLAYPRRPIAVTRDINTLYSTARREAGSWAEGDSKGKEEKGDKSAWGSNEADHVTEVVQ